MRSRCSHVRLLWGLERLSLHLPRRHLDLGGGPGAVSPSVFMGPYTVQPVVPARHL